MLLFVFKSHIMKPKVRLVHFTNHTTQKFKDQLPDNVLLMFVFVTLWNWSRILVCYQKYLMQFFKKKLVEYIDLMVNNA